MQNFALVDAQEEYEEHTMADDKIVLKNGKFHFMSQELPKSCLRWWKCYNWGVPCERADVLRFPKMWYFLRFRGFKPELLLPKVRSFSKYLFWKVSVSKKNPTATILICRLQHWYTVGQIGMVWACINGETLRSKLWPWDFFWTPLIFGDKSKISESSDSERL